MAVGVTYFNGLLTTAKLERAALDDATNRIERNIEENAIIYLYIPREERRYVAKQLRDKLLKHRYVVPEIKITGANTPNNNEIRFFYPHQKDKADNLFGYIFNLGFENFIVKHIKGYEGVAHKNIIEIWFGKRGG